jgi:hypothetical protein
MFHIFSALLNKGKFRIHGSYSSDPLVVEGFAVRDNKSGFLFLSNMIRQRKRILITGIGEYRIFVKMNTRNFDAVCRNYQLQDHRKKNLRAEKREELILQPYETVILEYDL